MRITAFLVLGFFLLVGCQEEKPRCVATMEGKVFFECESEDVQFLNTHTDSVSNIEFGIPVGWNIIQPEGRNSTHVMQDTSRTFGQGSVIAILTKNSNLTLKEYFYKEIDHADLDSSLAVIRAGRDQLGDQFCYWFQMERHQENMPPQHSVMYYMNGGKNQKIVLDALVYGTEQMDERFCRMKHIANTIKVN